MIIFSTTSLQVPDATTLIQYGAIGIFLVLFLARKIVAGSLWEREKDRADKYELYFQQTLIPLVEKMTEAIKDSNVLLGEFKGVRDMEIQMLLQKWGEQPPPKASRPHGSP